MHTNSLASHGYVSVSAVTPWLRPGAVHDNLARILRASEEAYERGSQFVVLPELSFTGYTAMDLFNLDLLLTASRHALTDLMDASVSWAGMVIIVGMPWQMHGQLFNVAAIILDGELLGLVPKTYLPTSREFQEARWFTSALVLPPEGVNVSVNGSNCILGQQVFEIPFPGKHSIREHSFRFAVEICQDLWSVDPPSTKLALKGANLIFNLSASNEFVGKHEFRRQLVVQHSARLMAAYVYTASSAGESTNDLVFSGTRLIAEAGRVLAEGSALDHLQAPNLSKQDQSTPHSDAWIDIPFLEHERTAESSFRAQQLPNLPVTFCDKGLRVPDTSTIKRTFEPTPFVPVASEERAKTAETALSIQARGLATRLEHTGINKLVLGISGGLDSTLALLVCLRDTRLVGLSTTDIIGITMPGPGTSDRTYQHSLDLMKETGITIRDIPITASVEMHLNDIGHDGETLDTTFENAQARERTQILMDVSNQVGGIVIGTGDLSELALGWCTYNGDHMSMYAVNTSVTKTLVRALVHYEGTRVLQETPPHTELARILGEILETPISPELVPTGEAGEIIQHTEDKIGPYILHDFFLYHMIRRGKSPSTILALAVDTFNAETEEGNSEKSHIYNEEEIKKWLQVFLRRFFSQQFKRSALPDGPKIGSISLSPRGDWRMPSDGTASVWLRDLE